MRFLDDVAAYVQANSFILIDPTTGQPAAILTTGTLEFPTGVVAPDTELQMIHNDPNAVNSRLAWSRAPASGYTTSMLQGPSNPAPAPGSQTDPRLLFYRLPAGSGGPTTGLQLTAGNREAVNGIIPLINILNYPAGGADVNVQGEYIALTALSGGVNVNSPVTDFRVNGDEYNNGLLGVANAFYVGPHPTHASQPALWRFANGKAPGTAYALLAYFGDVYVNTVGAGDAIELRFANGNGTRFVANQMSFPLGGGWYMIDTTWIRSVADKWVYIGGGWYSNALGAGIAIGTNGTTSNGVNAGIAIFRGPGIGSAMLESSNTGQATWQGQGLVLKENNANQTIGISAWQAGNGQAPIWRHNPLNGVGERWDAINNPNTAYIPIAASAFTVISTARAKRDITELSDVELLARVAKMPRASSWLGKVKPTEVLTRAPAPGAEGPTLFESVEHSCKRSKCPPGCTIERNYRTRSIGTVAEQHADVFPEHVVIDAGGAPEGIDVGQTANTALAAVGALTRRVAELEALVQTLLASRPAGETPATTKGTP